MIGVETREIVLRAQTPLSIAILCPCLFRETVIEIITDIRTWLLPWLFVIFEGVHEIVLERGLPVDHPLSIQIDTASCLRFRWHHRTGYEDEKCRG